MSESDEADEEVKQSDVLSRPRTKRASLGVQVPCPVVDCSACVVNLYRHLTTGCHRMTNYEARKMISVEVCRPTKIAKKRSDPRSKGKKVRCPFYHPSTGLPCRSLVTRPVNHFRHFHGWTLEEAKYVSKIIFCNKLQFVMFKA